jgi:hypothetical protein
MEGARENVICSRCSLELPPGAAHFNAEGCVEALKHALERASTCASCGTPVPFVAHVACMAKVAQAKVGGAAVDAVQRRAINWLSRLMSGETTPEEGEGPPSQDQETREPKRKGRRFEP